MRKVSLFCLNSSQHYASRVATQLGLELSGHEEREFEDGEHKSRAQVDVAGSDVYVIHSLYSEPEQSVNDKLCRLLFFIGSLRDAGAARVTAVTPYLCYARKDQRTQPHDPVTTRYVAAMFEAVGTDRIATLDVHNLAAFENAFRCRAENLKAKPLFVAYFRELAQREETVVVSPDFGAAKRAEDFRRDLAVACGREIGMAVMEKYRSGGVVSGSALADDVRGKTAIILDDLISSGGTLRRAAHACREAGASKIYAAATHGLFVPGAATMFEDTALDRIVVTDSVPPVRIDAQRYGERLQIVDSTRLIAEAITRWHRELD